MIRKNQKMLNIINASLDGLLIWCSYLFSSWFWLEIVRPGFQNVAEIFRVETMVAAVLYAGVMVLIYFCFHLYGSFRFKNFWRETLSLVEANILGVLGLTSLLYFFRLQEFSRGVLGMFLVLCTVSILCKRLAVRAILRRYRKLGYNQKHVLVVGHGPLARQYVEDVQANPQFGFTVDGYLSDAERPEMGKCMGTYMGTYADLSGILTGPAIDEVVIALEAHEMHLLTGIIASCEKQGTRISVIPIYSEYMSPHPTVDLVGESKLINVCTSPLDNVVNAAVKRGMDIVGSLFLILLTSPVMLVAAIGTKLSSPGPIIFAQERVGRNKKPFVMYKFRSMRINAAENTAWSKNEDPRKTKFGSLLRKTSIDELPQFFNVLKGDMSMIGPRPEIPHYVEQFKETVPMYMLKHQVRPGITGWAQVNGYRGDTSIEGRIRCDIWYIEHWSFGLDVQIVFRTIFGGMLNQEKLGSKKKNEEHTETKV